MILPIEIIIVILITIGNLTLGMIVYLKNHTSNINRSFLGFSLFLTFWIFGAFLSELVKDLYASLILSRVVYASVILAAISLFYFSIFFSKEKLNIIVNFICLGISGVVIYIILFTKLIIAEAIISSWGFDLVSGRFYFIFTSWVLILTILSVYKFFFLYRKSDNYQKQQLLYFLLGFGIFIFANVFFNIFVRQLTGNDIYYRFGNYSSIFLVGLVAYAIIKRELFGIKVILTELLVGLVAIVLLVELFLSESLLVGLVKAEILIIFSYLGISLIRSVLKEIRYRKEIARAYEVEKEARKQVEELTEAKTQFIMATQHHLRTPLTSMIGYLDLLFGGTYGKVPPKIKETLLKFQVSTKRLIRVVNALLDISQFQMGKRVVALEPGIDFESLIKEVMEELRFEVKIRGLYFKYEKIGKVAAIKADSEKLKVALFNIIDNAIKYTKQGGITVNLKQVGKSVQLSVKDTGIGVDPEQAKKLFKEAFARGDEAKKVHGFGRGIGVYITGHIIRAHNGKIWAESQGKGKGTTFFIELPVG